MRALRIALVVATLAVPGSALAAGETGLQRAKEAAIALQRNQVARAIELYTEALADAGIPNDRRAALYNDRGVAYARFNQVRAAIEDFNRSVQLYPESASVYNNRGSLLLAHGLLQEAVKDFERALLLAPGYAGAYTNRATALLQLGQPDAALRDFNHAVRLAPQSPAPLTGRGRLHIAQNRPHSAVRDFTRAIAKDGKFSAAYRARAEARIVLERFEEAVEDLSRAVAFEPQNVELHVLRGYCHLAARNTSSAIKDFQHAIELDQRSTAALEGLALSLAKADAHDDALNHLGKAIELDPKSAQAYAYRAIVYRLMNQPQLGDKDIERAVKLDPARPEVLWAKAELAEAAGNTEEAINEYKRAAAARPLLRDPVAALERLNAQAADEVVVPELAFGRWNVVQRGTRYYAVNPEIPRLSVPLEVMGEGTPKLVDWDLRSSNVNGIGVLRFLAGVGENNDEIEYGVVIDIPSRAVVAVEQVRQGIRQAQWEWSEGRLDVTSLDGIRNEYTIRLGRPRDVAQDRLPPRRVTGVEPPKNSGPPGWAPWAQPSIPDSRGRPQQKQKPKTLFDLIFKN